MRMALSLVLGAGLAACASDEEAVRYNWDALGHEFCMAALAGEIQALDPVVTPELRDLLSRTEGRMPARLLLQGYIAEAAGCDVRTRSAALVDVRREVAGGSGWVDTLVMVPEADGSMRIDDILFGTHPSDTLRMRLGALLGQ